VVGLAAPVWPPPAKSGKWASVHRAFRNGFFVPVTSREVEEERSEFQKAVEAEPTDELAAPPAPAPEASTASTTSSEASTSPPASATGRRGSFLVLGDWGWDEATHGNIESSNCQTAIANAMLDKTKELGDVKFIVNVGDSFYPAGVESRSDPKWDDHWRNRYAPELRAVPWYTTYGNHDYQHDPCACGDRPEDCAQFNNNASDTNWFYFPDFSWYKEHPELGLEVISLDMNQYMDAWDRGGGEPIAADCQYSSCVDACGANLKKRTGEAIELFKSRSEASTAKNLLVFSHYPTDYLWPAEGLMDGLKSTQGANGAERHIEYFGGHRHSVDQDSTASIAPNNNWLVGGGGGWGLDSDKQGFVVGEIADDFTITTYSVLVNMPCGEAEGVIQFK